MTASKPVRRSAGLRVFLRGVVSNYKDTGAIAPSSPFLARRIVDAAEVSRSNRVLEIGPGTGVFTREVLRAIQKDARFAAIEKNAGFARHLRGQFPTVDIVEGCATGLPAHLRDLNWPGTDCVVSGLPWAAMPSSLQDSLLSAIHDALEPGGVFATFAYFGPHLLPAGRQFRRRLHSFFPDVRKTPVEPRNLPPAFVYVARKAPPANRDNR